MSVVSKRSTPNNKKILVFVEILLKRKRTPQKHTTQRIYGDWCQNRNLKTILRSSRWPDHGQKHENQTPKGVVDLSHLNQRYMLNPSSGNIYTVFDRGWSKEWTRECLRWEVGVLWNVEGNLKSVDGVEKGMHDKEGGLDSKGRRDKLYENRKVFKV